MARKMQHLTDRRVDTLIDFEHRGLVWDKEVPGLRLYVGPRAVTWQFFTDIYQHGKHGHIFRTLGKFDRGMKATVISHPNPNAQPRLVRAAWHMGTDAARDVARVLVGNRIEGKAPPNKREGRKFADAFKSYCHYLERKAAEAGKPPRWATNVKALGRRYLLPQWGAYTLNQMSERPDLFADWIAEIKSAVTANHCYRVVRAIYKREMKRNPKLPGTIPTQAVDVRKTKKGGAAMKRVDFPTWWAAWNKIESPVRRAYHLTCLLTGMRSGELARVRWSDIGADTLTIGNSKTERAISVPLTPEIRDAIKLAGKPGKPHEPVFPGCNQAGHRDELPWRGTALRRTWKTFAMAECKVSHAISEFLMGHVEQGVSQHYLVEFAMTSGKAIIEAQHKISREMMAALKRRAKLRAVA